MTHRLVRAGLWTIAFVAAALSACSSTPLGAQPANLAKANATPGKAVYMRACSACHGDAGEGVATTPPVMGATARGAFKTAADLFQYVSREMPLPKTKAGSLSPDEYWAVVNFILIGHGSSVPAGGVNEGNATSVVVKPPD